MPEPPARPCQRDLSPEAPFFGDGAWEPAMPSCAPAMEKARAEQDMDRWAPAPGGAELLASLAAMEQRLVAAQQSMCDGLQAAIHTQLQESRAVARGGRPTMPNGDVDDAGCCACASSRALLQEVLAELRRSGGPRHEDFKQHIDDRPVEVPVPLPASSLGKAAPASDRADPHAMLLAPSEAMITQLSSEEEQRQRPAAQKSEGLEVWDVHPTESFTGTGVSGEDEDDEEEDARTASSLDARFNPARRWRARSSRRMKEIFGEPASSSRIYRLYHSAWFGRLSAAITAATCVLVAVDADRAVSQALRAAAAGEPALIAAEATSVHLQKVFFGWLAFEVVLGVFAMRVTYFIGPDRLWNLLDVVILLATLAATLTADVTVSFARVLRIARVSRSLRAMRFIRYSESLQRMGSAFSSIALSLFWVAVLLVIFFYVVGIAMMEGVTTFLEENSVGRDAGSWRTFASPLGLADSENFDLLHGLQNYYGGMSRTSVTLFRAVSGSDWSKFAAPLVATHWFWSIAWLAYVFVVLFGILSMVIGLVADIVRRPLPHDKESWLDIEAKEEKAIEMMLTQELLRASHKLHEDGRISKSLLGCLLRSSVVSQGLRGFGISVDRLGDIPQLMGVDDRHGTNLSKVARFLVAVRGDARAEDVLRTAAELQHIAAAQALLADQVHEVVEFTRKAALNININESHVAMM